MVWVNGYAIGRYWEIGPQQTLYVPGCWLKKGENEVIILDMAGPVQPQMEGLQQPILDNLRVHGAAYAHRKVGENLDLTGEEPVYVGTFKSGNGWQHVKFGKELQRTCLTYRSLLSGILVILQLLNINFHIRL